MPEEIRYNGLRFRLENNLVDIARQLEEYRERGLFHETLKENSIYRARVGTTRKRRRYTRCPRFFWTFEEVIDVLDRKLIFGDREQIEALKIADIFRLLISEYSNNAINNYTWPDEMMKQLKWRKINLEI